MSKMTSQTKHIPKDAQVIISMLKDMGITDYEPRVVNQLLEFTYRYVTCTLDDARVFANHAKKKTVDLDDVTLAVQLQLDRRFTNPPPRDILLEVARVKNNSPLPLIKPHCGIRLPPDRYSLNSCNYRLRNYKKQLSKQNPLGAPISLTNHPRIQLTPGGMMSGAASTMKMHQMSGNIQGAVSKPSAMVSSPSSVSIVNSTGHGRTVALVSKTQTVQPTHKVITVPKPVIKFSSGTPTSVVPKIQISAGAMPNISTATTAIMSSGVATTMVAVTSESSGGLKRKREDDDYDAPE